MGQKQDHYRTPDLSIVGLIAILTATIGCAAAFLILHWLWTHVRVI